MIEKNPFIEDAERLKISELEDAIKEILSISLEIEINGNVKLDKDKLPLYTIAFTKFMLLNSDHRMVREYPTHIVYGAYKKTMTHFINQPTITYKFLEDITKNYVK